MTEGKIKNNKLYVNMNKFYNKDILNFKLMLENKFNLDQIYFNNN